MIEMREMSPNGITKAIWCSLRLELRLIVVIEHGKAAPWWYRVEVCLTLWLEVGPLRNSRRKRNQRFVMKIWRLKKFQQGQNRKGRASCRVWFLILIHQAARTTKPPVSTLRQEAPPHRSRMMTIFPTKSLSGVKEENKDDKLCPLKAQWCHRNYKTKPRPLSSKAVEWWTLPTSLSSTKRS